MKSEDLPASADIRYARGGGRGKRKRSENKTRSTMCWSRGQEQIVRISKQDEKCTHTRALLNCVKGVGPV